MTTFKSEKEILEFALHTDFSKVEKIYQPSEDELREREARESKQSTSDVEESHSFDGEEVAF